MLTLVNKLNNFTTMCDMHVSATKESLHHQESIVERYKTCEVQTGILTQVMAATKSSIKIGQEYLSEKRANSLHDIRRAISTASSVIQNCPPIRLKTHSNYAALVCGPKDRESLFDDIEGGGCRSSVAFFTRKSVLNNTPYMPLLVCDEAFPTMSPETAQAFSHLLKESAKTMQIIVIEQHPDVTDAGVDASFRFTLNNAGQTIVTKVG